MSVRKAKKLQANPFGIITLPTFEANGRKLVKGTEVKIAGERGRFRFVEAVQTPTGKLWLDFIGGPSGAEKWRSFDPSRVKTVHRVNRTRANIGGK
jgi:hypothetical protein